MFQIIGFMRDFDHSDRPLLHIQLLEHLSSSVQAQHLKSYLLSSWEVSSYSWSSIAFQAIFDALASSTSSGQLGFWPKTNTKFSGNQWRYYPKNGFSFPPRTKSLRHDGLSRDRSIPQKPGISDTQVQLIFYSASDFDDYRLRSEAPTSSLDCSFLSYRHSIEGFSELLPHSATPKSWSHKSVTVETEPPN